MGTPPLIVVMGVSGSGKSVVGEALAGSLAVPYADGDDLHPDANIEKMRAGTPLTDEDRRPWLDRCGDWLREHDAAGGVLACSALTRSYRDRLRSRAHRVRFIELDVPEQVLRHRLARRTGHFMPVSLLASQLATLETLGDDESGFRVAVGADSTVAATVAIVEERLLVDQAGT
ncbi:MAG TPA: gluconokinase [Marmoricola sp.]